MRVKYAILTNSGMEKHDADLHEFLLEFHYMYIAKVVPPYIVMNDLCKTDHSEWGAGSRVKWKKFEITEDDYEAVKGKLIGNVGSDFPETPEKIDSAYKWSLWQYELTHGVPYEEYKKLSDNELQYRALLKQAERTGVESDILLYHLKSVQAADEVGDFLHGYLTR